VLISQKCQYALRAIFELSKHYGRQPVRTADVAEAQAIPARFLEVILSQLRRGGFVLSRRGNRGGFVLARNPAQLTVGEIIRFIEGPLGPVMCGRGEAHQDCPFFNRCVFLPMWEKVRKAISAVYDTTTFHDLVERARRKEGYVPTYSI